MLSVDKALIINCFGKSRNRSYLEDIIDCFLTILMAKSKGYFAYPPYVHVLLLAPVVVVSEQHTNAGPYPVTVQHHHTANMTAQAYPMPQHQQPGGMPMPGNYGPYPGSGMPQPHQAPYPTNTPYPMPQPGAMPMPHNPAMMNPPSYNDVVGSEAYQKQAPYNPNFSS